MSGQEVVGDLYIEDMNYNKTLFLIKMCRVKMSVRLLLLPGSYCLSDNCSTISCLTVTGAGSDLQSLQQVRGHQ